MLAVLLALLHAVLGLTATTNKSTTADEIGHLTAGLAYNTRGDFRLQPENGNLSQRWVALPMTIGGTRLPPISTPSWQTADVWRYGHTFFYTQGMSTDLQLFLGRMMVALVSAGTGLLVFYWSRDLFGWRGGFLSLALFVFCPAFLAHGSLATSDVMMTFFFLAATGVWWRHLQRPGPIWATLSALVFGLAFVAKFSAVLLPAIFALLAIVWLAANANRKNWAQTCGRVARSAFIHAVTAWIVIWIFYGFRFSAFARDLFDNGNSAPSGVTADFNHSWTWILDGLGRAGAIIAWLRDHQILPEAWLYGLAFVLGYSEQRAAFLSGDYSLTGWVSFFPFAFLVKTTLPFLGFLAIGLVSSCQNLLRQSSKARGERLLRLAPLGALLAVYGVTSLSSHLNIGHRHLLPIYPVLFISAGALGVWFDHRRPGASVLLSLLFFWHVVESERIRPSYLAYFNSAAGGPENGWRHLVDSSLDWGQDLPELAQWLQKNNSSHLPAYLSYFGTGDPAYEGIAALTLPSLPDFSRESQWQPLTAGIYCVSATMLQQVYSDLRPWTAALEKEFQDLRAFEPTFIAFQNDPARHAQLLRDFPASRWMQLWRRYESLRFARLCPYLQVRGPDANVGYSILIFRLSTDEIVAATQGSLREWQALIERKAASSAP